MWRVAKATKTWPPTDTCQRQVLCSQVTAAKGTGVSWKKETVKIHLDNREKIVSFLTRLLLNYHSLQAFRRKQGLSSFARETT